MAIQFQILGQPGRDNALLVRIDTGQAIYRLLFDCGEGCLRDLAVAEVQALDGLFLSHFHIDHVAGFDNLLRCTYNREEPPVRVWGPAGAADIIHHRLRGVTWNLAAGGPGEFVVTELERGRMSSYRFLAGEGFAVSHPLGEQPWEEVFLEEPGFQVAARLLDHGVPSAAFLVREKEKQNIDTSALSQHGLAPGPWLKRVKDPAVDSNDEYQVAGRTWKLAELRSLLVKTTPGDSIAYLTDFRLDPEAETRLVKMLEGCGTMVCENNFRDEDAELAQRTFHMVSRDVARLACATQPRQLILFHLSDRYTPAQWQDLLAEVRGAFPETYFPDAWNSD